MQKDNVYVPKPLSFFNTTSVAPYPRIRLVGANNTENGTVSQGRLEVFYNGDWGTICDDSFGHIEATIACRELGFSTSISYSRASSYPVGSGIGEVSTLEYILLSEVCM